MKAFNMDVKLAKITNLMIQIGVAVSGLRDHLWRLASLLQGHSSPSIPMAAVTASA